MLKMLLKYKYTYPNHITQGRIDHDLITWLVISPKLTKCCYPAKKATTTSRTPLQEKNLPNLKKGRPVEANNVYVRRQNNMAREHMEHDM